jgi:hypothetical protein
VELVVPQLGDTLAPLTAEVCCGTVCGVTEALYEDAGLLLDDDGITIRRYYFPLATPKRIAYADIQGITPENPDRVIELLRERVRPS